MIRIGGQMYHLQYNSWTTLGIGIWITKWNVDSKKHLDELMLA